MAKPAIVLATHPVGKLTLCIDIGGSGVKAIVIDENQMPLAQRMREKTPHPATPEAIFRIIEGFAQKAGPFDRVSVGFPGVVRNGVIHTAANLDGKWIGFDIDRGLEKLLKRPVRAANDAAIQGLGAVSGKGLELVITLGTGVGGALYKDGFLVAGLEIAHHPFCKDKTYEQWLGNKSLEKLGRKKWNKLLQKAIDNWEHLFNYDRLFIGGGNAEHIKFKLPPSVKISSNQEGLYGGLGLWREHSV